MITLKLSPDLLDLVSKVYSGNKDVELIQYAAESNGIYGDEKYQFEYAYTKDE